MRPIPDRLKKALHQSHVSATYAEIVADGVPVLVLTVTGGNVSVDGSNAVERQCSLELAPTNLAALVPSGREYANIAIGRPVHVPGLNTINGGSPTAQVVTDGVVGADTSQLVRGQAGADAYCEIDLGSVHRINRVKIWHYYGDPRTYYSPRTEVSQDGVKWEVVSKPAQYVETSAGHERIFYPRPARYVRDYISGSNANNLNHWVEMEVYAADDPLTPYGNELRVYRGVRHYGGGLDLVPLGVFGITDPHISDLDGDLRLTVQGYDRGKKVARARLRNTYRIPSGTNVGTAIRTLIQDGVPAFTNAFFNFTPTTRTTPLLVYEAGTDRWQIAQDLAAAIGMRLYFDAEGICVMKPIPVLSERAKVWDFLEGEALMKASKVLSGETTYNHVVVSGESLDPDTPPVRGEAFDNDKRSPTWIGGSFGDVVYFFSSPSITSTAQATETAEALLRNTRGLTEQVDIEALVNPALEVGDVVRVHATRLKVGGLYIVDSFKVPMEPEGKMQVTMRRQSLG